jgi:hypothetical protein
MKKDCAHAPLRDGLAFDHRALGLVDAFRRIAALDDRRHGSLSSSDEGEQRRKLKALSGKLAGVYHLSAL